ncbi:DUF3422 family protein [Massilia cavernae]|uniref:DUF3422 domain-containing protein n=1 Tax=Massilia cavernae TaxID=2320864 RepID=A0A418XSU4_9BURK|nr:DUF3422 domain-containing protein [Massilia cavernae]RJG15601.1 DUF3422 domain-containing protein [Massilia cavernae]
MAIVHTNLNHLLRIPLAAEIHSRPSLRLTGHEQLTHLAVYLRENGNPLLEHAGRQHELLAALCLHFGVAGPTRDARYFFHDFGSFRLQWESHTEFATYTFAERLDAPLPLERAFDQVPLRHVPEEWLQSLAGRIMVATHVAMTKSGATMSDMGRAFGGNLAAGCDSHDFARVWTDFAIAPDGFGRVIIQDLGMQYQQAGRLVQRVLEVETYRMMALLGLPHAQQSAPVLNAIEDDLVRLTAGMTDSIQRVAEGGPNEERELLQKLTALAARMEKQALDNSYRFAASKAYYRLVLARIDELRETRVEGIPTVREFMDRRLAPAMNTCESTVRRQEELAERIARTNALLRTRVGIVQEQQNRDILESLNTRAAQQLRLQQAVEGLSVVAISYYSIGLLSYVGKAAKAAGMPVNPDIATGALIPLIVGLVWLGLRRMHHRMSARPTPDREAVMGVRVRPG